MVHWTMRSFQIVMLSALMKPRACLGFITTLSSFSSQSSSSCTCRPYAFISLPPIRLHGNRYYYTTAATSANEYDDSTCGTKGTNTLQQQQQQQQNPLATIVGYISNQEEEQLKYFLINAGYTYISSSEKDSLYNNLDVSICSYQYVKASGMLKLVESRNLGPNEEAPKWIPVQSGEEVSEGNICSTILIFCSSQYLYLNEYSFKLIFLIHSILLECSGSKRLVFP